MINWLELKGKNQVIINLNHIIWIYKSSYSKSEYNIEIVTTLPNNNTYTSNVAFTDEHYKTEEERDIDYDKIIKLLEENGKVLSINTNK